MSDRSRLIKMKIVNFGCIGSDGLTVELDNIVCLVGANNTGKSTILKAYECAINLAPLNPEEIFQGAAGNPASVELWVHIPRGVENIDEKWKEVDGELLLVRSRWEWPAAGGKPVRTTWDPSTKDYATDGKASGLDTVFNSRLPKPFRIGSLENPEQEQKKLVTLVVEPVITKLKSLMLDDDSDLRKKIEEIQVEVEKPVEEFREAIGRAEAEVNKSYRRVFSSAEIKLNIAIGDVGIDPAKSLLSASQVEVSEAHGQTRWSQQGTGSQRALFWSMLQVRSELNRIVEERRELERKILQKTKDVEKLKTKLGNLKSAAAKSKCEDEIKEAERDLESLKSIEDADGNSEFGSFLPGYMLLIDEPETALHPAAVRAAKEHLYSLAAEAGWQVMLSTHCPAFVDPLKDHTTIVRLHRPDAKLPPNIYRSDEMEFSDDERQNLQSLLAFDATVAEMFFGPQVIVVEGDTEFAAFSVVMNSDVELYPLDSRPLLIRARGKTTIPILIRILSHFKIGFSVLHDIDAPRTSDGTRRNPAYTMNTSIVNAIAEARASNVPVVHRCSCPEFERHHGLGLPQKDKPFEVWLKVNDDDSIRATVGAVLNELRTDPSDDGSSHSDDGQHFEATLRDWVSSNASDDPAFTF